MDGKQLLKKDLATLYRLLGKKYENEVESISFYLENPAIIKKKKKKTTRINKVLSKGDSKYVIDLKTKEIVTVEISNEKSPNDMAATKGKIVVYEIDKKIGNKICHAYKENKKDIKTIFNAYNLIVAALAVINLPMSIIAILSAVISKIGIDKYCKNRKIKVHTKRIYRKG